MKTFLCLFVIFILAASTMTYAALYYRAGDEQSRARVFYSQDRQWLLSGEKHIFEVTDRAFDITGLFGYAEGANKWSPVGGAATRFSPHFTPVDKAATMKDDEYVVAVMSAGAAAAYPLKILALHQVVNDAARNPPVLVYFGNAGRTVAAWSETLDGKTLSFACTGYLYGNVDLLFDASTESLFLPMTGRFVAGKRLGQALAPLPSAVMTLGAWRKLHPDSMIMRENTGAPDVRYPRREVLYQPLRLKMRLKGGSVKGSYADTAPVVVLTDGFDATAVPLDAARRRQLKEHKVAFGGVEYTVHFADDWKSAYVTDPAGALAPSVRSLWRVYTGIFPEGDVSAPGR